IVYRTRIYLRQLSPQGILAPRRSRISTGSSHSRDSVQDTGFACGSSNCLFTWRQRWTQYVVPVVGDRVEYQHAQPVITGFDNVFSVRDVVPGPDGFVILGLDSAACDANAQIIFGPLECEWNVRALRVGPGGEPLGAPFDVNQGSAGFMPFTASPRGSFDGTNVLVSFDRPLRIGAGAPGGGPIFLARIGPGGA